eukprot:2933656-Prymnesium_polylepis.2
MAEPSEPITDETHTPNIPNAKSVSVASRPPAHQSFERASHHRSHMAGYGPTAVGLIRPVCVCVSRMPDGPFAY